MLEQTSDTFSINIEKINDGVILSMYREYPWLEKWYFETEEELYSNLLERIRRFEDKKQVRTEVSTSVR